MGGAHHHVLWACPLAQQSHLGVGDELTVRRLCTMHTGVHSGRCLSRSSLDLSQQMTRHKRTIALAVLSL